MYDLPDMDALRAILDQPLAPELKTLLEDRLGLPVSAPPTRSSST